MAVLTAAEMALRLNVRDVGMEPEIEATIAEATAHIEQIVGPLEPSTRTALVSVSSGVATVPVWPVLSVTSGVDSSGVAVDVSAVKVRPGGVLSSCPASLYEVTYEAGRVSCPADLKAALSELVRHLWQARRPASGPATPPDGQAPGYLLPYRVATLLEPHRLAGFA